MATTRSSLASMALYTSPYSCAVKQQKVSRAQKEDREKRSSNGRRSAEGAEAPTEIPGERSRRYGHGDEGGSVCRGSRDSRGPLWP